MKLIFGCGYLGLRVARLWRRAGHEVQAVTRSVERAAALQQEGVTPIVADVLDPASLKRLPAASSVLYAVGFDRRSGRTIREVYVAGLSNVLEHLSPDTQRFIYVSSTGVYGQTDGEVVDETSPCRPQRDGGQACLEAERLLESHPLGDRAIVLRMAGLYGPGRIPRAADLLAGKPVDADPDGYLNLIHIDDAAQIVLLADMATQSPRTYLVSDGQPVLRRDYFAELARLLGAPPPTFAAPTAAEREDRRDSSNKRISNARLLAELQPRLAYPSFREGLRAIVADETK